LAEDGRKLSKRLRNYPDPAEMLEKHGADALRLYLLNSPAMKAEELRLTEDGIRQSLRDVIIPLWSSYNFFVLYANIDGWSPREGAGRATTSRLDRWIVSELQTLVHNINEEMEAYRLYRTVPAMVEFVEKLTNWYIRRSRRRFWKSDDDDDKASAYATLYQVLVTFIKCLAPVLPFVTETIYSNLVLSWDSEAPESVHLCDMPVADESLRDTELEEQMNLAMRACALGRALRSKHDLKIHQPLARAFLLPPDERSRDELSQVRDLIADELNIKELRGLDDDSAVYRQALEAAGGQTEAVLAVGQHWVALEGGYAVRGPSDLEVHIARVVFCALDICQNPVLTIASDQSHGDSCHRLPDRHASIHQRKTGATH
ncbi:MAG: class I tRNA ligase family protein, partial [Proteobacteria bacterium]|nr:class I tRNA ligase family protein [Pseudomonadota bacterium]